PHTSAPSNRRARSSSGGQARAVRSTTCLRSWVVPLDLSYRDFSSPLWGEEGNDAEWPFLTAYEGSYRSIAAIRYHFASGAGRHRHQQSDIANHRRADAVGEKVDGAIAESKVGTTWMIAPIAKNSIGLRIPIKNRWGRNLPIHG